MKHFLITNRAIEGDWPNQKIVEEGKEPAQEVFRVALYDENKNDFSLLKDTKANQELNFKIKFAEVKGKIPKMTGSKRLFLEMYKTMSSKSGGDVLFYIHGFNNDMKSVRDSMKDLIKKYTGPNSPVKQIIIFSWPARNDIKYRDDFRDAKVSGFAIARAARKYGQFLEEFFYAETPTAKPLNSPCEHRVHLMAHSMGNFVLQNMISELVKMGWKASLFDQVIMTAADVDNDVFEHSHRLGMLPNYCKRAHIYFNSNDRALFVSSTTKNPMNRLGKTGPKNTRTVPANVNSIDVVDVAKTGASIEGRITGHSYHLGTDLVVGDMLAVLNGERTEEINRRTYVPHRNIYRINKPKGKSRK